MTRTASTVDVKLLKKEIRHRLGYNEEQRPAPRIGSLIDYQMSEVHKLVEPSYSYSIKRIDHIKGHRIFVGGEVVFKAAKLSRMLSTCSYTAIFLLTIGDRLEREIVRLSRRGQMVEAAVLDAIGSEAVEKVAQQMEKEIRAIATAQGTNISLRYSPGYCDWNISEQEKIFQVMNGTSPGVRLTSGFMMLPRKSVSGIIGIGKPGDISRIPSACALCSKQDCPTRREEYAP